MEVSDVLAFLAGRWSVERSIEDSRSGQAAAFAGQAGFIPEQEGRLVLEEEGGLSYAGHSGPARRRLVYEGVENGMAMVYFAGGRFFVDLDLRGGAWRAVHDCGADRYEIVTAVRSSREVEELWRVRGPSKRYDALTLLRRLL